MASRISQMRNEMPMLQPQPRQQQLNNSIEQVRGLMRQVANSENPQQALISILQTNPSTGMISSMLRNGNSLEGIARQMAKTQGIDIQQLIQQLQGGM